MISKAALLLFRDNEGKKELLFAREKNKQHYVFPGGKQESNETIEEALHRELLEELGAQASDVQKIGVLNGQTPDKRDIEMHLYSGNLMDDPKPQAEIEEIAWMTHEDILANKDTMTPMTLKHVMPFLADNGLW